ncbi:phage tail protein [Achromobacter insuavis]
MDLLIAPYTVTKEQADAAPATGTPGWATDGNPSTNKPATQWPAYAFNAMQEELTGVILGGGLALNRSDNSLLLKAIQKLIGAAVATRAPIYPINAVPTQDIGPIIIAELGEVWRWTSTPQFAGYRSPNCGAIAYFASVATPAGHLKANGAAVSVATYAALAAGIYCGDALNPSAPFGYRCTDPANPATTRNATGAYIVLPDLRGEFPRGWDDARGSTLGAHLAPPSSMRCRTSPAISRLESWSPAILFLARMAVKARSHSPTRGLAFLSG